MATVNIQLSEFSDLCRLCGSKTSVLMGLHIFEREGDLREIYKKIKACLPVQVNRCDKLPKMVCEECVYKLDDLFEFRERSIKTEYAFHNMLKNSFSAVCNDTISIPLETYCPTGQTEEIHIQPAEVEINLENSPEQLEAIITLPLNHHTNLIKCEPEVVVKSDVTNRISAPVVEQHETSEGDPEGNAASPKENSREACHISSQELDGTIHIQEIRSLHTLNDSKEADVHEVHGTQTYILSAPAPAPEPVSSPAPTQWFFCNICGKSSHSTEDFQAHCEGHSHEGHWVKCTECVFACASEETLISHMRSVHQYEEATDPLVQADPLQVREPLEKPEEKKETKSDGKTCMECGKEYKTKYKLAEHMRKHTGEKPFKCSMCDKAFRSRIGLAQHEAKHTGQYDYNCMTCGKGFQCKSYLIVHQRVHSDLKPYPCETCGRNFKTKQSLIDHQNRHLGVKPYICDICGRGFITKGLCKSHERVHSGVDNRQYPCSVCNKLFVSKSYLTTHLRIHTGEKPFMCEVCGKGFLTRVDLRIHSTMHTGEKSFVCEMCGKAFARRDALRCHKRSHTGERPYKCDICGQGFTQFSPMAIHKRLHTGERPYSCDICLKAFVSRSTMMSHRKKHPT